MAQAGPAALASPWTERPAAVTVLALVRNDMLHAALLSMLGDLPELSVEIHTDSDGEGIARLADRIAEDDVDVVLVSLNGDAGRAARLAGLGRRHGARVLLLVRAAEEWLAVEDDLGAVNGIILEPDLTRELLSEALVQVLQEDLPLPTVLAESLLTELRRSRQHRGDRPLPLRPSLTARESQALHLLVQGLSNKQIARRLGISDNGAKRHVANVLAKLNCPNRTGAAATALRLGLVRDA